MEVNKYRLIPRLHRGLLNPKHMTIPNPKQLEMVLNSMWSTNHAWSKAEIIEFYTDEKEWATDPTVVVKRTCPRCHSTRTRILYYRDGYWNPLEAQIKHPENYHSYPCANRMSSPSRWLPQPQCEFCGRHYRTEERAKQCAGKDRKQKREREWKENQVKKNLQILKSTEDELRFNLAIYRLYRYSHLSPKRIAQESAFQEVFLDERQIWNIIGKTFKMLCLSDGQCVFRKYFER